MQLRKLRNLRYFARPLTKSTKFIQRVAGKPRPKLRELRKITKFTKTAKFTIICKTIDKVYEIYSKGCREALSKVTRIAKITKFTKTAKFTQWMKERTRYIHGI